MCVRYFYLFFIFIEHARTNVILYVDYRYNIYLYSIYYMHDDGGGKMEICLQKDFVNLLLASKYLQYIYTHTHAYIHI